MSAFAYLMSSIINAEAEAVPINTVFDMVPADDAPAMYRPLYTILRQVWANYRIIEPVAVFARIKQIDVDTTRKEAEAQFRELFSLVASHELWEHYLRLSLMDIKTAKAEQLGRSIDTSDPKEIDRVLADIRSQVNEIASKYEMQKRRDFPEVMQDYLKQLDKIVTHGSPDTIRTGFDWERYIKGFRPGDYIILAARPKMGKSAVANAIAVRALKQGKRVMYVNNEMDEISVTNRLIANVGKINCELLQEPEHMSENTLAGVMQAAEVLQAMPLNLYCMKFRTPREIETEAKRLKEIGQDIDLLIVDYLQLLSASDENRRKSRYDEVSYLSWEMKMLANDLKIPVLVLSQLSRKLEDRTNKRPIPADLRDSGSLEQDATAVMFLYRDEVYNPESDDVGIGEINVSINRNGKSGITRYGMDFDHMDIHNLDYQHKEAR